jgi:hypothetical protein
MKMEFTPSALTDCSDYILSVNSCDDDDHDVVQEWNSYSFVIDDDDLLHACLPVHQCINTLHGNDKNEGQNFSILSDNEISTQICDEQKFMPNTHFECTPENEIEISQTDLDEEFFDCSETMDFDQNCVNVMTRQQSKLATGQATASNVDHTAQQDTSQDSSLTQVNTDTASADSQINDTQQQVNTDQSDQGNSADTEPMHTVTSQF